MRAIGKMWRQFQNVVLRLSVNEESELGCYYSTLLQLPYFNPVRMLIVDPMHNLYMGTANYVFNKIWTPRFLNNKTALSKISDSVSLLSIPSSVSFSRIPSPATYSLTAEQCMLWVHITHCIVYMISFPLNTLSAGDTLSLHQDCCHHILHRKTMYLLVMPFYLLFVVVFSFSMEQAALHLIFTCMPISLTVLRITYLFHLFGYFQLRGLMDY